MIMAPDLEKIKNVFNSQFERGLHPAAQLVVRQGGKVLLDLSTGEGIDGDTPFLVFSVSKVFTGLAVHHLIETGKLSFDTRIADIWPEFGCKGKEKATIRHVFLHQAGIPAPHLRLQVWLWPFWGLVTRQLAGEKALFEPGARTAYHLVNYGFIFGEVVRRVTGMPVDRYLAQTFFEPMGLQNIWLRAPAEGLRRSPRLTTASKAVQETCNIFNLPPIRGAQIPAANMRASARSLASAFQMLLDGGLYQGKRYFKTETLAAATSSGYDGYDDYVKTNMNWGYGFILGGGSTAAAPVAKKALGSGSSWRTFAGIGMGTCMVWADPPSGVVTAFTTNGMLDSAEANQRWADLSNAVWAALN